MKHYLIAAAAFASSVLAHADAPARLNRRTSTKALKQSARPVDDKYGPFLRQGFFLTADFLYWIAHEEGLEYATTGLAGVDNGLSSVAPGSTKKLNFKWKPGFRLGLGWTLPNSYWDLSANWTWYHTTARGSATHSGDPLLNPLYSSLSPAFISAGTLDAVSAKWRLCYNTLDIELGRSFYPNKYLALRPHAGVRGAWINQHYSNRYTFDTDSGVFLDLRKLHNNYHSAGIKAALDSLWSFNRYWGIFVNVSVSSLAGNFYMGEKDILSSPVTNPVDYKSRLFSIVPVLETAIGLHLMLAPQKRHYWFDLNAGWEHLIWFNQNQMPLFPSGSPFGDHVHGSPGLFIRERANLHLMGFTLNAKLHF